MRGWQMGAAAALSAALVGCGTSEHEWPLAPLADDERPPAATAPADDVPAPPTEAEDSEPLAWGDTTMTPGMEVALEPGEALSGPRSSDEAPVSEPDAPDPGGETPTPGDAPTSPEEAPVEESVEEPVEEPANVPAPESDPTGASIDEIVAQCAPSVSVDEPPSYTYPTSGGGGYSLDSFTSVGSSSDSNVQLSGDADLGYFRSVLAAGWVPSPATFTAAGFFAEHHSALPSPTCGEAMCPQGLVGTLNGVVDGAPRTVVQVGLNSPLSVDEHDRPPLHLVMVLDTSGSMGADGKLTFLQQGLHELVDALRDEDHLALIAFDSSPTTVHPLDVVAGNRALVHEVVDGLNAAGGTNIYDALALGYEAALAGATSDAHSRVILVSDGMGIFPADDVVAMSSCFQEHDVGLSTVGLGLDFDFDLMSSLAEDAAGSFYFVEDTSAVTEVFTEEIETFSVPIAYDIELAVDVAEHYVVSATYGSKRFVAEGPGSATLSVPAAFLAHRTAHDDQTEGGGRRGGGSTLLLELALADGVASSSPFEEVAAITLTYRDASTDETVTHVEQSVVPFAPWDVLGGGHFDDDAVEKSFLALEIYRSVDAALDAFYSLNEVGALAELEVIRAAAVDYNATANDGLGDDDIAADILLLSDLIDAVVATGAELPDDFALPHDPWPTN